MNWGWKLTIVYLTFMAGILTLVFKAKGEKVDLVAGDYYKQELAFGQRMDATKNARELSNPVNFVQNKNTVAAQFPEECKNHISEGTITFYCPSDASNDRTMDIAIDNNGLQNVDIKSMKRGLYLAKVQWKMNDVSYYDEYTITLH